MAFSRMGDTQGRGRGTGARPRKREPHVEEYEALKRLVAEAEEDIRKAEGGNKAAGTRARKMMQDIKEAAQAVRNKILDLRETEEKK